MPAIEECIEEYKNYNVLNDKDMFRYFALRENSRKNIEIFDHVSSIFLIKSIEKI